MKKLVTAICILALCHGGDAAPIRQTLNLEVASHVEGGMLDSLDRTVRFEITLTNLQSTPAEAKLTLKFNTVAIKTGLGDQSHTINLGPKEKKTVEFTYHHDAPGFVELQAEATLKATGKTLKQKQRVGSRPEAVKAPLSRSQNFESFWQQSLEELRNIDPQFQTTPVKGQPNTYEVSMKSFGNVTVRGWLEIPPPLEKASDCPVVIRFPGYGNQMKPTRKSYPWVVFSFNPRAHGNSQDEIKGKPVDYWLRGLDRKEDYFYRGAFLDCVRALDYVASLKKIDPDRIAVIGTSQGGGLALATAALDPRVDFCAPDIPFLCDWKNYFQLSHWPEMQQWIEAEPNRSWSTTLNTMSYFDTLNFADRISCPVFMGVGLQDGICPPTTNFSVYQRLKGQKEYRLYPEKGHGLGQEHRHATEEWLMKQFGVE